MNFSKIPAKSTKLKTPLNMPNIKPKMVFSVLYDEMLPSNKNNNRLVNNLNIISDITKIIPMQKDMIIVGLIETYLEMKNDKST
jgi:hypothetical protein